MPRIGNIHYVILFKKTSSLFLESSYSKKRNMATQINGRPMKNREATTMDLVEEDNEFEEEEKEEEEEGGSVLTEESSHLKRKKLNLGKKKGANSDGGGGLGVVVQVKHFCQVEKCGVDLDGAIKYHRRHKVCQTHAKAPIVLVAGLSQRFCQQCSRFHELSEFDGTKKSCRQSLAGHNERRRRKTPLTIELEDDQSKQINEEARPHMDMTLSSRNTFHTVDISG